MSLRRKLGLGHGKDRKDHMDNESSRGDSIMSDADSSAAVSSMAESKVSKRKSKRGLNLLNSFGGSQNTLSGTDKKTDAQSLRSELSVDPLSNAKPSDRIASQSPQSRKFSQTPQTPQTPNGHTVPHALPLDHSTPHEAGLVSPVRRGSQAPVLVSRIGEPDAQRDTTGELATKSFEDTKPQSTNQLSDPTADRRGSVAISESNHSDSSDHPNADTVDPIEIEHEQILGSKTNTGKLSLVAVTLKEAALDSPTFRASFNHLNTQIVDLLEWCDLLLARTGKLNSSMSGMRDLANDIIEVFMPDFASNGLLGQDYTTLACVRYSQSVKGVWTEIILRLRTHYEHLNHQFQKIKTSYKPYKAQREKFQQMQAAYDKAQSEYMAMSKSEPPAELQKASKKAVELRREYLLVSIKLTSLMSHFRLEATTGLVMALTDPMQIYQKTSLQTVETAIDLHRLRQCAVGMKAGKSELMAGLESSCEHLKRRVWESETTEDLSAFAPEKSKLPADFKPEISPNTPLEQFGWVFIKNPSQHGAWSRRWAFIKNGLFGYLSLSVDQTYVLESDKVPVGDCQFVSAPNLDRRFCFLVISDNVQVTVQAESFAELKGWLTVAAAVSRTHISLPSRLYPWSPEFASVNLADDTVSSSSSPSSSPSSHRRHQSGDHLRRLVRRSAGLSRLNSTASSRSEADSTETASAKTADPTHAFTDVTLSKSFNDLLSCVESIQYIDGLSTMAPSSQGMLAPPVVPTVPMPTSMTPWALVGYAFLRPVGFPNALTANFSGSVNWSTYQPNRQTSVTYQPKAPDYPSYYPKELVAQDMIRRALFENMVLPDEYLVTIMRGFARLNDKQWVPARIYATNRRLLHQISIFDYSTLRSVRYSSILDVECKSTMDFDDLQVIVRNVEDDANSDIPPYTTVTMRCYIDSGILMQRRLQYILDNHKSRNPDNLEKMLAELSRINAEYAAEISRRVAPATNQKESLGTLWGDVDRALQGPMSQNNMSSAEATSQEVNFGHNLGKTMKYTISERDFPLSPRGLFHIMFGEHETVFHRSQVNHRLFQKIESGDWYDRNGVLERVVHAWISGIKEIAFKMYWDSMEQVFVQRIERKDSGHLYIISERRPVLRLPHGSKFSILVRFAIVRLPSGTARLQVFAEVHWRKESKTTAKTMEKVMLKLLREEMELVGDRIDEAIEALDGRHDEYAVIAKYGRIKASSEAKSQPAAENTIDVHLGRRTYFWSALKIPATAGKNLAVIALKDVKDWFSKVASVDRIIVLGLVFSILINFFLFSTSSYNYWKAKWDVKEAEAYVDSIIPNSPRSGSVFTRAIYLRDIDDAITKSNALESIPNNLCALKFEELLRNTVYESVDDGEVRPELDFKSEQTLEHLQSLRTGLAIERNKLLTQLRLLNDEEQQMLQREFVNWLHTEVALCAKARAVIPDLNVEAFDHLKQYCSDCNSAASIALL